jgi:2-(1,2-epoxy-1,2-dihydrophenyl)acetyl-CoA isomerase
MSVVVVDDDGAVVTVRLNRPEVLNALNVALLEELVAALRTVRQRPAIVLEGEGRAFCVGEDLKESLAPQTSGAAELRASFALLQETTRLMTASDGVVIAAVHGYAIGGGAELALAADLVIAAPDARVRFPEVALGHAVTGGISARLPAIVGLLRAKELLLTSRWVDGAEALALGLVNELVDEPGARARELATAIAAHPQRSVAATKRALELATIPHQETVLAAEVEAATYCFAADEASRSLDDFRAGHRR